MHVDQVDGGELLQYCARCESRCERSQRLLERDLQTVGDDGDEDMRFDAIIAVMVNGPYRQIALEFLDGLFDFGQLHILLPQLCRIRGGEVGAQQIVAFATALPAQLGFVERVPKPIAGGAHSAH